MKEYKLVYLNRGVKLFRDDDLKQAEEIINQYISEGWELQQIISPADGMGVMVGVFFRQQKRKGQPDQVVLLIIHKHEVFGLTPE